MMVHTIRETADAHDSPHLKSAIMKWLNDPSGESDILVDVALTNTGVIASHEAIETITRDPDGIVDAIVTTDEGRTVLIAGGSTLTTITQYLNTTTEGVF